jgi:hypothetical protein
MWRQRARKLVVQESNDPTKVGTEMDRFTGRLAIVMEGEERDARRQGGT